MCPGLYVFHDDLLTLRRMHFIVTATTDLSLLLGGLRDQQWLICEDKTSERGTDDIELDITADERNLRYISNNEICELEQDAVRDLDQFAPAFVPYRLGVDFQVIERDDIDLTDIGSQTLPPHDQLSANPGLFVIARADPKGNIHRALQVNVDDGA